MKIKRHEYWIKVSDNSKSSDLKSSTSFIVKDISMNEQKARGIAKILCPDYENPSVEIESLHSLEECGIETSKLKIETDDYVVTLKDNPGTKIEVFDKIVKFLVDHDAFSGESIVQSDSCIIDAPLLLADISDNILKINWNGK